MKTKLLLAVLVLISAGALAQEPEQAQNREAIKAMEHAPDHAPVEEALQKREQKRLERTERKNARKENALNNRSRGSESSEAARTRSQSVRQEKSRVENRPGVRPENTAQPAQNAERTKAGSPAKGRK